MDQQRQRTPARGDIIRFYSETVVGGFGQSLALVLSPQNYNENMQSILVAPIAKTASGHGFEVLMERTRTSGVILCNQVYSLDLSERRVSFIEAVPNRVIGLALKKVALMVV